MTGRYSQFVGHYARGSPSPDDELAFIGTVSLETRKQIGMRTSLSLWTDYEYISSVPEMHYADFENRPTRISDDSVLRHPYHAAAEYRLRLLAALRSAGLYSAETDYDGRFTSGGIRVQALRLD